MSKGRSIAGCVRVCVPFDRSLTPTVIVMNPYPIAIVNAAGVFPGAASLDQFWRRMVDRTDCIVPVSPDRWAAPIESMVTPKACPDKAISDRAGLIGHFHFDPSGIALPPEILTALDPLYHLVLHCGRDVMGGGAVSPRERARTGVVLAAIALPTDAASTFLRDIVFGALEHRLFPDGSHPGAPTPTPVDAMAARVTALPATLLATAFDLGGGAYTLDAACASSLYAVKLACDALMSGRVDAMIAGGVSRPDCLYTQVGFTQLKALSPSGRCAPFDHRADGLVVGEGAGLVLLKRLDDAVKCGDTVMGVIRGIGMSNDMREVFWHRRRRVRSVPWRRPMGRPDGSRTGWT